MEGIVSKEINSPYIQKRTKNWLKVKCTNRQEFVIAGCTKPKGTRKFFGSLILGYYDNNQLIYCGHVGTGFNEKSLKEIFTLINKYKTSKCSFHKKINEPNILTWVKPKIVVEIEFTEWTNEGILRHPSFQGGRLDKAANEIVKEDNKQEILPISTIKITHPEKILYPERNISKSEIVNFYINIAKWILPFIENRPLAIVRCPQGWQKTCFYQKHLKKSDKSEYLHEVQIDNEKYIYINSINGLIKLIQMGTLEIHPWNCKIDKLDNPDYITFDLDPSPELKWKQIINAAFLIKKEFDDINLKTFLKSTGGKGLHLVIPINRIYSWEDVLLFSKIFAQYLCQKYPTLFISKMTKSKRFGKIFIDYLRNHKGATAISPYSLRAKENAPVATLLFWDELTTKIKPNSFNMKNLERRLNKLNNIPWGEFYSLKQELPIL